MIEDIENDELIENIRRCFVEMSMYLKELHENNSIKINFSFTIKEDIYSSTNENEKHLNELSVSLKEFLDIAKNNKSINDQYDRMFFEKWQQDMGYDELQ